MGHSILTLLSSRGASSYLGEPVTQLEHALQCAALAANDGAAEPLIVAALLHDMGHLLDPWRAEDEAPGADGCHEDTGSRYLSEFFKHTVTEPIRLHVAAKRYLCAIDPQYMASLSSASYRSLLAQGGPMNKEDIRVFEQSPWARDAVLLRHWDEAAKRAGLSVPPLGDYEAPLARQMEWR